MSTTLSEFLCDLDRCNEPIGIQELKRRLDALDLELEEIREFIRFCDHRYQRNLLHAGPSYHALVLCWKSGQRSPIHDHRGSACGVRVLRGVATETIYQRGPDRLLRASGTRELPPGSVTASYDTDIHDMANRHPGGEGLVTLHIYTPPLLVMGTYTLTDSVRRDFVDPIHEFAAGAGI